MYSSGKVNSLINGTVSIGYLMSQLRSRNKKNIYIIWFYN